MADWELFSRNRAGGLSGGLRLSTAKAVVRHLGVDTALIETPYTPDAYARTERGCGLTLHRNGRPEFSGLVASERTLGWDAATGRATIKVQAVGDDVHLADRLVLPDPARAGHEQTTRARYEVTAAASTAMWQLVRDQAGPGALPERRVPGLFMGADPGVGAVRTWAGAFTPVLSAAAGWSALSGADLGLRIVRTPDGLRCDVHVPRQLAAKVRFSADLSNLHGFTYTEAAPAVTYALVAGQGELTARTRVAASATAPADLDWGRRIETYIDRRDEADTAKLAQAAADALTEGAGQVNLSCTLTDSQAATYGRDWGLGDQVTVHVGLPGTGTAADVVDIVREVAFEVTGEGAETIRPAIGGTDAKAVRPTPTQQTLTRIGRVLTDLTARR